MKCLQGDTVQCISHDSVVFTLYMKAVKPVFIGLSLFCSGVSSEIEHHFDYLPEDSLFIVGWKN